MKPEFADELRKMLLAEMAVEDRLMVRLVEGIPEDHLTWKPEAEKAFRANELAHHAIAAAQFFLRAIDGTEDETNAMVRAPTEKSTLLATIRRVQQHFKERLAIYTPEQLAQKYDFFGDRLSGIEMLRWHKLHMIHHRGQLALYLRLMGAKVPSTYGPSGDEG